MSVVGGTSRDKHFALLDFYRFAGAMLVACCHFGVVPLDHFYPLIDFFFVLSGFVIMHIYGRGDGIGSIEQYTDYLRKRLARIYPLFALTLGMYVAAGALAAHGLILSGSFPWFRSDTLLANVLLVHAWGTVSVELFNFPSWSVSAEFFVYLLFPALFLIVRRFGPIVAIMLAAIYVVVLSLGFARYSSTHHWWQSSIDFGCLRAVPSFLAGMAIYPLATSRFADLKVPRWVAHIAPCSAAVLMGFNFVPELIICVHVLAIFLLARADLSGAPGFFSRPLPRLLANASYGVYMLHAMIGQVMLKHLPQVLHINPAWHPVLVVAALILTPIAAALCYLWFEEPARRYLGGRRSQAATATVRDRLSFVSSRLKGTLLGLRRRRSARLVATAGGRADVGLRQADVANRPMS